MKPEHRAKNLFAQAPEPIAPSDVPELVREHRAPHSERLHSKGFWQKDDGSGDAEGDRLAQRGHIANVRAGIGQRLEEIGRV